MIRTEIVGKYINQTTRCERTIIMLLPEEYWPGSERFVTDRGECVEPAPTGRHSFVSICGETLLPLAGDAMRHVF